MSGCYLVNNFHLTTTSFIWHVQCARTRSFAEQMAPQNYCLEHTKPLFNEYNLMNLNNLYHNHNFMELFKILKYKTPVSLNVILNFCPKTSKLLIFFLWYPKLDSIYYLNKNLCPGLLKFEMTFHKLYLTSVAPKNQLLSSLDPLQILT